MKKIWIAISGLVSLVVFTNATLWEGPAAVSLGGELPEKGYYAATNSFPRNTVVDVTNLETGKIVRVMVAAALDSPGFLALLSPEAAAEVGLQGRSVARIRMSRPGDPIAFSRLPGGETPSTVPDYNPRTALDGITDPPAEGASPAYVFPIEDPPIQEKAGPEAQIVDILPDAPASPPGEAGPRSPGAAPAEGPLSPPAQSPLAQAPLAQAPLAQAPPAQSPPAQAPLAQSPLAQAPPAQAPLVQAPPAQSPPALPQNPEEYSLSLFPAERRPPADPFYSELPQGAEIAPFNRPEGAAMPIDESLFIAPAQGASPAPAQGLSPGMGYVDIMAPIERVAPIPPASLGAPDQDNRISPEMAAAEIAPIERLSPIPPPGSEPGASGGPETIRGSPGSRSADLRPESPSALFSVPLIDSLERSKYYLQLKAFSQAAAVEGELSKIGKNYPLVIMRGEESGKTIYRILLGPVNQGESNALLRRFKNRGYTDAFLRQGPGGYLP